MNRVFFDIRDGFLRVLMTDGQTVTYAKRFEAFSAEKKEEAGKILQQVLDESGTKPGPVYLIAPSGDITIRTYTLQKMSLEDARLIVRRKIMIEDTITDPVFHLMPRHSGMRQQEFVAALISPETLKRHATLCSGLGMPVTALTSSFHATLRAFEDSPGERPQTAAVFEIGRDTIEILVVSPSRIIACETVSVASDEGAASPEQPDTERVKKKRLYAMIDALYKFMLSYRETYADTPIEKVLLCGRVGNGEKLAEAIEEGIGVQTSLWDPFGGRVPDGPEFVALSGYAAGVFDGTAVNLLAPEFLKHRRYRLSRSAVVALSGLFFAIIASVVFMVETRYRSAAELLIAELNEKQALARISGRAGLSSGNTASPDEFFNAQTPLYGIFRYLGNHLPDGMALSEIVYRQQGADEMLYLKCESHSESASGKKRYFRGVIDALNASGMLTVVGEPSFSVNSDAKKARVQIQLACRVMQDERKK